MTASQIYWEQVARDRRHHQERVEWLTATNPTWSCGTPVPQSDIKQMLDTSSAYLNDETGMFGFNSAHDDD